MLRRRSTQADGFAQVFPEHKYAIVKILQQSGHIVGMTGDGVNDAPALKQADVGIAVSGATEAARAAAALVLTAPGLSVIIDGIAEARRIFERMTSYVLYRIAMTIAIMVFVVLASIYYHFFPLTAIMLIALALLDDVPIMTIAFDNATVPPQPVKWELDRVLVISSVLGIARCYSKLRPALSRRYGSSPGPSAATNDDVSATRRRRSSHVICDAHKGSHFWKPPYPSSRLFFAIIATQIAAVFMCSQGWLVPVALVGDHRLCLGL